MTIYDDLTRKLGREPTSVEVKAYVKGILSDGKSVEATHYQDGSCTPEWLRLMNEMEHEE